MKRKIIAVDIDDVIAAQVEGLLGYSNKQWGHNLAEEDYDEDFAAMWGVSVEEALQRVQMYLASGAHGRFRHYPDSIPVLKKLAQRFELVLVTSRRKKELQAETEDWLQRFFPDLFSQLVFAGIWDGPSSEDARSRNLYTKADRLREIGADYLIDDQPKHCLGAAEIGVSALLFGSYPWNRNQKSLPKGVTRVVDWGAVERYFDAQG